MDSVGDGRSRSAVYRLCNSFTLLLRQLLLILAKNFLLQIRRPIGTFFELIVPVIAVVVIVGLRFGISDFQPEDKCFVTFPPDYITFPGGPVIESLYFAPNTPTTNLIAHAIRRRGAGLVNVTGVNTQKDFERLIDQTNQNQSSTCFIKGAGLFFENLTGPDIRYSIRLRQDPSPLGSWNTDDRGRRAQPRGARVTPNFYLNEGFLHLQKLVDEAIIEVLTNQSVDIDVKVRQFPYPQFVEDLFLQVIDLILPLFFVLSFIYSAGVFVKELVLEKETRIRETMRMMGLSNWVLVSTWFIKQLLFYLVPIIAVAVLLKYGNIFPKSNLFLILVFLLFYIVSGIAFCFLISVWFSSARIGLMAAFIIWFVAYLPYTFMSPQYDNLSLGVKVGTCLISNTCVGFGTTVLSLLELRQDGLLFSNFATPLTLDDGLHMGWIILMLFIDTVIYMLLYWYIDAVKPGKYGVARPFYFLFLPSYWCGGFGRRKIKPCPASDLANMSVDGSAHEAEPTNLSVGISIKGMTKVYNRRNAKRRKVAVDNLSLNMYKGQITALLGHNGAGKTTTMSILTGLFSATAGGAEINGYDINTEMDLIRRSLGICPQHNVLFDRLTVREHLAFFAMLKGLPTKRVGAEVDKMIEDLQLADKRTVQSQKLSGGMKRKLSVGIALVGGSEVVILDEPTSGMDPYARRATWDLLVKHKEGRTMLLTTHFMDEADLLGDRIAIMAEGKLKCSGSSLFLKGRYGVGYHMTMVKEAWCDSLAVTGLVTHMVTGAEQVTDVGAELSFILPSGSVSQFPDLFDKLDSCKTELGISSFGVSVTTMEEVFIKVGEGVDETLQSRLKKQMSLTADGLEAPSQEPAKEAVATETNLNTNSGVDGYETQTADIEFATDEIDYPTPSVTPLPGQKHLTNLPQLEMGPETVKSRRVLNTGLVLWFQQFCAMFLKRLYNSFRFWVSIIWQLIIPLAFVLWALILGKTLPGLNSEDPSRIVTLNSSSLSENRTLFWAQFGNRDDLNLLYVDSLGITNYFNYTGLVDRIRQSVESSSSGFSSPSQCCGYKYQILDKYCATRSSGDYNRECSGNSSFGYRHCIEDCLNCLNAKQDGVDSCSSPRTRETGDSFTSFTSEICPVPPSVTLSDMDTPSGAVDDYDVFVAEELLRLSGEELDTNDFFLRFQGGFVVQPTTPIYSTCSCANGFSSNSDVCAALAPAKASEQPSHSSLSSQFLLTLFQRNVSFPIPLSAIREVCDETFQNETCDNDWTREFNWVVDSCISSSPNIEQCNCNESLTNCNQSVGSISEDTPTEGVSVTVWYNNQPFHMPAAVLNGFYNILLRQNPNFRNYTITVTNAPLPRSVENELDDAESEFLGFTVSSTTTFGLSFLYASFIVFLVQEKYSKAKHLQFVSGVSATSYWLSAYVFDLINALIPAILTLIFFAGFQLEGYTGENIAAVFLLLILSNWATIPLSYCFSFLFSNALVAFALMFVIYYFISLVFLVVTFVLQASDDRDTADTLHYFFLLHPVYALAIGLTDMYTNQGIREVCTRNEFTEIACEFNGVEFADSVFEFNRPGIGHVFLYLAIEGPLLMLLTIVIERSFFLPELRQLLSPFMSTPNGNGYSSTPLLEDDDVSAERRKVAELSTGGSGNEAVVVKNLIKFYRSFQSLVCPCFDSCQTGNKLAVNQINLIIPSGECFGLLGVNGAGKTTTFKMLTGDISPSSGTATVAGFDIRTQLRLVQQRIGYCPQFDAVLERLTGRELLTMFARLRGIPEKEIREAVQKEIFRLDLTKHADKRCGTYSGGNKRKLSTAVALVGDPPILLLDEPTTGMDPATRRFLWDTLTGVIREGRSVILTSHSMEECEALCTRLAIMVNGQFKCLGSIQHLKSKFGSGYTLQIKINPNARETSPVERGSSRHSLRSSFRRQKSDSPGPMSPKHKQSFFNSLYDTKNVHSFVSTNFPGSLLLEEHQGSVTYQVPGEGVSWSSIFHLVESNKESLGITDYSVSQTTLDQVFINFAREQEEEEP